MAGSLALSRPSPPSSHVSLAMVVLASAQRAADRKQGKKKDDAKPQMERKSHASMLNLLKKRESAKKNQQYTQDKIEKMFKVFDINDDGTVSRSEFVAALTRTNGGKNTYALTQDHAEALFDEMDEDGNGSVDPEEFAKKWAEFNATYGTARILQANQGIARRLPTFIKRRSSKSLD